MEELFMWVWVAILLVAALAACQWVRKRDPPPSKSESQYLRDMEELGPQTEAGLFVDQEMRKKKGIEGADK